MRGILVVCLVWTGVGGFASARAEPVPPEYSGLARMLLGAATGKNTSAAGVPSLLGSRNPERTLEAACGELNQRLPMAIDKESFLVRCLVLPRKRVMLQIKLINFTGPSPDLASFEVRFVPPLQRNICTNADVQILSRMEVDLRYRYLTNDSRRIGDVYINTEVCRQALR
jgi:hypothetical protein